jgi:hypothetical protein
MVINDETSRIPTILMDAAITKATIIINIKCKLVAGIPEALACSSSNERMNHSL